MSTRDTKQRSNSHFVIEDEESEADGEVEVQLYNNRKVPDMYTPVPTVVHGEEGKSESYTDELQKTNNMFVPLELDDNDRSSGLSKEASCLYRVLTTIEKCCTYITCGRRCIFFSKIENKTVGDEVTL